MDLFENAFRKLHIVFLGLILLICFFSHKATAQELDKYTVESIKKSRKSKTNKLFQSSYWMPDANVSLLTDKNAQTVWAKFSSNKSKCGIRNLDINIDKTGTRPIDSYFVFKTDGFYVFLYEFHMSDYPGPHWVICNKKSTEMLFDSYSGVPAELIGPLRGDGSFGGCPSPAADVRFRQYTKHGPQFLEIHASRCQTGENHYEVSIDITGEEIRVVPGSRLEMEWISDGNLWQWWYAGEKYKPKRVKWNDDGSATWTRILGRRPVKLMDHKDQEGLPLVLVRQECVFDKDMQEIKCDNKIIKNAKIANYQQIGGNDLSQDRWLIHAREKLRDVDGYREAGFLIDDNEIDKLKKTISMMEDKQ